MKTSNKHIVSAECLTQHAFEVLHSSKQHQSMGVQKKIPSSL